MTKLSYSTRPKGTSKRETWRPEKGRWRKEEETLQVAAKTTGLAGTKSCEEGEGKGEKEGGEGKERARENERGGTRERMNQAGGEREEKEREGTYGG